MRKQLTPDGKLNSELDLLTLHTKMICVIGDHTVRKRTIWERVRTRNLTARYEQIPNTSYVLQGVAYLTTKDYTRWMELTTERLSELDPKPTTYSKGH